MELVSQVVRHLRCQPRSETSGRDLESPVLAQEDNLPAVVILHGDLVGAVAMDVCAHFPAPSAPVLASGTLVARASPFSPI
jgi:hypothetical protein